MYRSTIIGGGLALAALVGGGLLIRSCTSYVSPDADRLLKGDPHA